jgi:hypothetical protein
LTAFTLQESLLHDFPILALPDFLQQASLEHFLSFVQQAVSLQHFFVLHSFVILVHVESFLQIAFFEAGLSFAAAVCTATTASMIERMKISFFIRTPD